MSSEAGSLISIGNDRASAAVDRDSHSPDSVGGVFPVVGIGASAGGLEACQRLFSSLPADSGMAFVLVQHLHPDYPAQLAAILSRSTSMPVMEVEDEPELRPNHVYVIPPAREMLVERNSLYLRPRSRVAGAHRPIDSFLRSLAEFHTHRAIGVLLSGTGNDGMRGISEIKAEGGITFAQDESAQFDGMPRSAIDAGYIDFVLPPEGIAQELARISRNAYVMSERDAQANQQTPAVRAIIRMAREATGVDFSHYDSTTLNRRIARRMLLHHCDQPEQFLSLLRSNPEALQVLYRDLIASVTSFFRDPAAFDALERLAFPALFEGRALHEPVRVWVLGCSTGEEAYSLAISMHAFATRRRLHAPIQIFATDLNEHGLEIARKASYGPAIEQDVPADLLLQYFEHGEHGYRVRKQVRDLCVFARQNVLADPPFARLDLIACRNLLSYTQPVLRQRLLPLFHSSLRAGGFLWLGPTETADEASSLFTVVDGASRIYRRVPVDDSAQPGAFGDNELVGPARAALPGPVAERADQALLRDYCSASAVIDESMNVFHARGDTSVFVVRSLGRRTLNLMALARAGLLAGLRAVLADSGEEPVSLLGVEPAAGRPERRVRLDVIPLGQDGGWSRYFLVVFAELPDSATPWLERRNAALEAGNDQLQASNEELQSLNEELQSLNEELRANIEELTAARRHPGSGQPGSGWGQ